MRATICVEARRPEQEALVNGWFERWADQIASVSDNRGCGCCVDIWEVDAPAEAISELPGEMLAQSEWSDPHSPEARIAVQRRRAVQLARDVLAGHLGVLEGARELSALRHSVGVTEHDRDFLTFFAVDDETDGMPMGAVRRYWQPEALAREDAELQAIADSARDDVFVACQNVIARFAQL
jgi:hypothetical protein